MSRTQKSTRFSMAGWNVKEFLLGNKEFVKLVIAGAIMVLGPLSPELNIIAGAIGKGVLDELDFWGGTFSLVVFATIEVILFAWVFGIDKAWDEIHKGADMRVPRIYKFIIKYITPLLLFLILGMWIKQEWLPIILMKNIPDSTRGYVLFTRLGLVFIFIVTALLVKIAWRKRAFLKKGT